MRIIFVLRLLWVARALAVVRFCAETPLLAGWALTRVVERLNPTTGASDTCATRTYFRTRHDCFHTVSTQSFDLEISIWISISEARWEKKERKNCSCASAACARVALFRATAGCERGPRRRLVVVVRRGTSPAKKTPPFIFRRWVLLFELVIESIAQSSDEVAKEYGGEGYGFIGFIDALRVRLSLNSDDLWGLLAQRLQRQYRFAFRF